MGVIKGMNLTVDSNYILFKNVYTLAKTKTLYGDLEKSLKMTFDNYFTMYPWDKIFLVFDSKYSWRKDIYEGYKAQRKGNREKQDVNWEFVFNTFDRFKKEVSRRNVIKMETNGIEGDDWIRMCTEESNSRGYSNMIISSDNDLNQLLKFSIPFNGDSFINFRWNDQFKNSRVYLPENYQLFKQNVMSEVGDLFNLNENDTFLSYINNLERNNVFIEVDPEQTIFLKLISGDNSDNIKSVLNIPMKSNPSKTRGIGEAGAKKIWHKFKEDNPEPVDFSNDNWIDDAVYHIASYKKVKEEDYSDKITENLKINRKLILLNKEFIPDKYKRNMKIEL